MRIAAHCNLFFDTDAAFTVPQCAYIYRSAWVRTSSFAQTKSLAGLARLTISFRDGKLKPPRLPLKSRRLLRHGHAPPAGVPCQSFGYELSPLWLLVLYARHDG